MLLVAFLFTVFTVFGCYDIPISSEQTEVCIQNADGRLTCNFELSSSFIYILETGACARIAFSTATYNGINIHPENEIVLTTKVVDVFLVVDVNDPFNGYYSQSVVAHECSCPQWGTNNLCQKSEKFPETQCQDSGTCTEWGAVCTWPFAYTCLANSISGGCVDNYAYWCGSAKEVLTAGAYIGTFGSEQLYVQVQFSVESNGNIINSMIQTVLLNGFNTFGVTLGNFDFNLFLTPFSIPQSGLGSQGSLVYNYFDTNNIYVFPGIVGRSAVAPVSTPFWFRCSTEGKDCWYDSAGYSAAFHLYPSGKCTDNSPGFSVDVLHVPGMGEQDNIDHKVNPVYTYRSFDPNIGRLTLGLSNSLSLFVNMISHANSTISIISEASFIALSAGSFSVCGDGTVSFWVYGQNSVSPGLVGFILSSGNESYSVGSIYATIGFSNNTFRLPYFTFYSNKICAISSIDSCVSFSPVCVQPVFPTGNMIVTGGNSVFGGDVAEYAGIAGGVLFFIFILIIIFVVICACRG